MEKELSQGGAKGYKGRGCSEEMGGERDLFLNSYFFKSPLKSHAPIFKHIPQIKSLLESYVKDE